MHRTLEKARLEPLLAGELLASAPPPPAPTLPAFVSAAPPRSEGEALLQRIFSRAPLA